MQPAQPYPPQMTMPPTAAPYGAPMQPTYGYMPMRPPIPRGPALTLLGTLLIGVGTMVLSFSLLSVGFGNQQSSGTYPNATYSISIYATGFTIGTFLIGIGIVLRALGVFLTKPS